MNGYIYAQNCQVGTFSMHLAGRIRSVDRSSGFEPEGRGFNPHIRLVLFPFGASYFRPFDALLAFFTSYRRYNSFIERLYTPGPKMTTSGCAAVKMVTPYKLQLQHQHSVHLLAMI